MRTPLSPVILSPQAKNLVTTTSQHTQPLPATHASRQWIQCVVEDERYPSTALGTTPEGGRHDETHLANCLELATANFGRTS